MRGYADTAWRLARHWPGPWLLAASLGGWLVLAARTMAASSPDPAMAGMAGHPAGHAAHHGMVDWLAMVAAMSPLVLRNEIAWLWRTNLPRRRRAAIALFASAYVLPWLLLGLPWLAVLAGRRVEPVVLFGSVLMLAAWHAAPHRQRLLNACHRRPALRAFGLAMAIDTMRFGWRAGLVCTAICGPAMLLAMAVPGYHLLAMAVVTGMLTVERYLVPRRPVWRLPWRWIDRAPSWQALGIVAPPIAVPTVG